MRWGLLATEEMTTKFHTIQRYTLGLTGAPILIIWDYPTKADRAAGQLNAGPAGRLLAELFQQNGASLANCRQVNVLPFWNEDDDLKKVLNPRKTCPGPGWEKDGDLWVAPELLEHRKYIRETIAAENPQLIITVGDVALWAVLGLIGVAKWHGSRLIRSDFKGYVVPIQSPEKALFDDQNYVNLSIDVKRAIRIWRGEQRPRFPNIEVVKSPEEAISGLGALILLAKKKPEEFFYLSLDLETRNKAIACIGLAWTAENALVIPILKEGAPFFWLEEIEHQIIVLLQHLLYLPNVVVIGQNIIHDVQYLHRQYGIVPPRVRDTMIGHHSIYSTLRKGLDFLSLMYAQDHVYWKDEIKDWDPSIGEQQYWLYNGKDACITWEIWPEIEASMLQQGMAEHGMFQQEQFFPVFRMMARGVRYDELLRKQYREELIEAAHSRQERLNYLVGHELNANSSKQLSDFFYTDLGLPAVHNLATDAITTNSPAMASLALRYPWLKPICQLIVELRSIGVFLKTFIQASPDDDGRMRCSYNIAGTATTRYSSSQNAFYSGMNLQNIPVSEKVKIKSKDYIKLPNIRKLFIPDHGKMFFDMDLQRADLYVVVWEADDSDLKKALRLGVDMHCYSAADIFDIKGIPYEELVESHPNYPEHRARIGEANRSKAKVGVHATNYGVGDYKLAQSLGITRLEADRFRTRWFGAHPGIKKWHLRTETLAKKQRFVENKFGARLYTFRSINLPELLGWLPQSTVAGVINRILIDIDKANMTGLSDTEILLQVHDSIAGQFPIAREETETRILLGAAGDITVPYDDPLVIPATIHTSSQSWGHCK